MLQPIQHALHRLRIRRRVRVAVEARVRPQYDRAAGAHERRRPRPEARHVEPVRCRRGGEEVDAAGWEGGGEFGAREVFGGRDGEVDRGCGDDVVGGGCAGASGGVSGARGVDHRNGRVDAEDTREVRRERAGCRAGPAADVKEGRELAAGGEVVG